MIVELSDHLHQVVVFFINKLERKMKKLIFAALMLIVSACANNKMLYINENGQTVYQA